MNKFYKKIIYSNNVEELANILEIIYKYGKYYKIYNIHLIKQKRKSNNFYQQQLNIISSIPYIEDKYSEKLLRNLIIVL
jgi:ERCC4-type nuclease